MLTALKITTLAVLLLSGVTALVATGWLLAFTWVCFAGDAAMARYQCPTTRTGVER